MKKNTGYKPHPALKIVAPLLSSQQPAEQSLEEWLEDNDSVKDSWVGPGVTAGLERRGTTLSNCTFNRHFFPACTLPGIQMNDVVFDSCDLSNVNWNHASLHRVAFRNCKLTGTNLSESTLYHISFHGCVGEYLNFSMSKLEQVSFEQCDLPHSSFTECRLRSVGFIRTKLTQSEFYRTSLRGIDLRMAEIPGIQANIPDLRGAVVSALQMTDLVPLLEVVIKDEE